MLPKPETLPTLLPLRLVLLGAFAGCAALASQHVPSAEWPRFLAGLTVVGADGTTLATAMGARVSATILLVAGSVLLAVTTGAAVAFTALRVGFGMPWLAGFLGRLLAAVPVIAIALAGVGWIVGRNGLSVESLLPYHPAPARDHWGLAAGRSLWWWLVPCWTLALPLTGAFISSTLDRIHSARQGDLRVGLRARGLQRGVIHYRHTLPLIWPALIADIGHLGLLAFGYVVFVEEALGVQGWGAFFASAMKAGDVRGIAGALYFAGWMSAAWCLLIGLVRLTARPVSGLHRRGKASALDSVKPLLTAVGLGGLALVCCAFGETSASTGLVALLGRHVSPLVHDLRGVASACAVALMLAGVLGGFCAIAGPRLPRFRILEMVSWSPVLVWTLGVVALLRDSDFVWVVPGVFIALGGSVELGGRWRELRSGRALEGSRAVGTSAPRAWRMHVLPELLRHMLAWILESGATLLVWVALIDSLKPPGTTRTAESLGMAITAAKETVLTDLPPLIVPALVVAISALFFNQLSRIVRYSPPTH